MNDVEETPIIGPRNVLGQALQRCSSDPLTGYFRDGSCRTDGTDQGMHTVCAVMTDEFLKFSRSRGNDLSTPRLEFGFPGLISGDRWCLCAGRWYEAFLAGMAPKVVLAATNRLTLDVVPIEVLQRYAVDLPSE